MHTDCGNNKVSTFVCARAWVCVWVGGMMQVLGLVSS
jgi:hypothetical protein